MIYDMNPKSKADLLGRILSQSFTGDLRDLAVDRNLTITRSKPHTLSLKFPDGKVYLLTIHRPKPEAAKLKAKKRWQAKHQQLQGPVNENVAAHRHQQDDQMGRYG